MMSRKEKIDRLEKALFRAHRRREEYVTGEQWRRSVMDDIRRPGSSHEGRASLDLFGRFAWRFSAVACCAALILLIYVLTTGLIDYQDLAMQFFENPVSFML